MSRMRKLAGWGTARRVAAALLVHAALAPSVLLAGTGTSGDLVRDDDRCPDGPEPAGDTPSRDAYEEVVVVRATGRLGASGPAALPDLVAPVAVADGDTLRAGSARSVPEALERLPSIAAVDVVGNGRQLTLAIRGFDGAGDSTALVVDGVRLNEPDTGFAAFEHLRLEDIDRVEVVKGPHGFLLGAGALAGVVNVVTRAPPDTARLSATVRAGSFGFREASATGGAPAGRVRLLASGGAARSDGFRGGAFDEEAGRVAVAADAGGVEATLALSLLDGRWRQPGKISRDQLRDDPWSSRATSLDAATSRQERATLRLERAQGHAVRWSGVLAFRDREGEILTTGLDGFGFLTRDATRTWSGVFEGAADLGEGPVTARWGVEISRDRLHPRGFATDSVTDGSVDALEPSSDVRVTWRRAGLFAGLGLRSRRGLVLDLGARHDRSGVGRTGVELAASGILGPVDDRRDFSETTAGLGLARRHVRSWGSVSWRAAWSQAFEPPSAIELFAFPGYSSNAGLRPARGRGITASLSGAWRRISGDVEIFRTDVADEIVYDAGARLNLNAAATRREGVELGVTARLTPTARLAATAAFVAASCTRDWRSADGPVARGRSVPLVSDRAGLALFLGPFRGLSVTCDARRLGHAVLDSDFDNSEAPLPSRLLVGAAVERTFSRRRGTLRVSARIDNLLDEVVPAWGTETAAGSWFTVAPPRAVTIAIDRAF